jgi:hypothetical protein
MSTQLQLRKGNTAQTAVFTGALAEVTVDTDQKTVIVHDGTTVGGNYIITKTQLDSNVSILQGINTSQNTRISIIEGVDSGQNTTITAVNNFAQSAYDTANSTNGYAVSAFGKANSANVLAQSAFDSSNAVNQFAQSAYNTANGANGLAVGAYDTANGANGLANGAYAAANTAYSYATQIQAIADAAYLKANAAFDSSNAVNGFVISAFNKANSANILAQSAFDTANLKFNTSGGNITGSVTITANNDLTVTGNLFVLGNTTSFGTQTLEVVDPMILLATGNYTTDLLDIGFAGSYNDGANAHTGLFRDAPGNKEWYFFEGYTPEVSGNNNINVADASFRTSNVNVNYLKSTGVVSPVIYSTGATTNLSLSDIGLVAISVAGQTYQFGASGIEANQGLFGGSFGGNRLSLNSETNLISNRLDTVKIQTGTGGSIQNEFVFANNAVTLPGALIQTNAARITNTFTTSSTSQVAVDSFSASTYRSAKYEVQVTSGSNYHVIELRVVHNGSTTYLAQYGEILTSSSLGTFDTDISGGNVRLLFTGVNSVSVVKVIRDAINI